MAAKRKTQRKKNGLHKATAHKRKRLIFAVRRWRGRKKWGEMKKLLREERQKQPFIVAAPISATIVRGKIQDTHRASFLTYKKSHNHRAHAHAHFRLALFFSPPAWPYNTRAAAYHSHRERNKAIFARACDYYFCFFFFLVAEARMNCKIFL